MTRMTRMTRNSRMTRMTDLESSMHAWAMPTVCHGSKFEIGWTKDTTEMIETMETVEMAEMAKMVQTNCSNNRNNRTGGSSGNIVNTLTCLQSSDSPNGNSPKGCGNSHVTPSNATTTDTIFNYGYRRFYRCIVRFLWVVGAKVPWSSNWASKQLRNRKRVNFLNTWPVLSTSWNILALTVPFAAAPDPV